MQTVAIFGFNISSGSDEDVERLTVKHSSSSSILSEIMGMLIQSEESLSLIMSVVCAYE